MKKSTFLAVVSVALIVYAMSALILTKKFLEVDEFPYKEPSNKPANAPTVEYAPRGGIGPVGVDGRGEPKEYITCKDTWNGQKCEVYDVR